jgi:hypothetical protein
MFNGGREIPVYISGEGDGAFDRGDYLEFFGLENRSEYSTVNVYWLSWNWSTCSRMEERNCSPGDSVPAPTSFPEELHFEENHRYQSNIDRGEGQDHWFWSLLLGSMTETYTIELPGVAELSAQAALTLCLKGKSDYVHDNIVSCNGRAVAELSWYGIGELVERCAFDGAILRSGDNTVSMECPGPPMDQVLLNWIEVAYPRTFTAHNGRLRFRDSWTGPNQFEIGGFSEPSVEVYRLLRGRKRRARVLRLRGRRDNEAPQNRQRRIFEPAQSGGRRRLRDHHPRRLLFTRPALEKPAAVGGTERANRKRRGRVR